jgi:hypothetical protein
MTKREKINRNIGLTFDFIRQIIKDPSITEKIPDESTLEFIEKDFVRMEKPGKKSVVKRTTKYLKVKTHLELI